MNRVYKSPHMHVSLGPRALGVTKRDKKWRGGSCDHTEVNRQLSKLGAALLAELLPETEKLLSKYPGTIR